MVNIYHFFSSESQIVPQPSPWSLERFCHGSLADIMQYMSFVDNVYMKNGYMVMYGYLMLYMAICIYMIWLLIIIDNHDYIFNHWNDIVNHFE